ncbi:MAG: GntR family transcriptional regulator [Pseudomonadota bacterium]
MVDLAAEKTRRSDAIAEKLEAMIVAGEIASGQRLDEVRLSEQFAVSRTPLREAFQRLEGSGLIELLPRRGAFVRSAEPHEMVEMFEVMAEMEALAGRLAARRASVEQIDLIETECGACSRAANDPDDYYRANERFHNAIYAASGNDFLRAEATRLHNRLRPFRRLQLRVRGRIQQSLVEHNVVVAALKSADGNGVADALRAHISIQGERFSDLVASYRSQDGISASGS